VGNVYVNHILRKGPRGKRKEQEVRKLNRSFTCLRTTKRKNFWPTPKQEDDHSGGAKVKGGKFMLWLGGGLCGVKGMNKMGGEAADERLQSAL